MRSPACVCGPFLVQRGLGSAWGLRLLSQNKQHSQILSSRQRKGHGKQLRAYHPWSVTDLPGYTGCVPSHPLSCPSFHLNRSTSTTEAGPMPQPHGLFSPNPKTHRSPQRQHSTKRSRAAKPAESKVFQGTWDTSPHLAPQDPA